MRAYYVGPAVDIKTMTERAIDAKTRETTVPIADLISSYLLKDGVEAVFGLSGLNPPYPPVAADQEKFGRYRVTRFRSDSELRAAITKSVDPFCASDYFQFRSLLSCRSAFFGYDGQAFLCLHVEDEPPTSPDPSLFFVEERSDFLTSYDYFDGVALVDEPTELS